MKEALIKDISKRQGVFTVTWRYRDDILRRQCNKLLNEGFFKSLKRQAGVDYYKI